jgi:ComF family protein
MLKSLIALFYPPICLGCEELLLANETAICTACFHKLTFTTMHLDENNKIHQLFYGRFALNHASSMLYFKKNSITQHLIHQLKYKGKQEIGTILASIFEKEIIDINQLKKFNAIIPIPLHKKRLQERGYNQLTTFGQRLSFILKIEYDDKLLIKLQNTKTQTKKKLAQRIYLDNALFALQNHEKYQNKHLLIIDDVITTGATLENALMVLSKIKNCQLSILTMAISEI